MEWKFFSNGSRFSNTRETTGLRILLRTLGLLLASGATLLPLNGCGNGEEAEQPPAPPDVQVVAVRQEDVPVYQEWVGSLTGEVNATITAQVSGYLISRDYQEGSSVKAGQVLFRIDPSTYAAALAEAQAQLQVAEARKGKTALDVKRYTPLAATDAVSKEELDDAIQADKAADGQIALAQAAVHQAELNLGFATIRSPVDGVAGLAIAQVGDLIGPSFGALTTVAQIHPIRVYFTISQQLVIELQKRLEAAGKDSREGVEGPELQLTLATGYVYPLSGRVRFADNQVDVRTGSVRVVGEFPNPNGFLVPGMFVRVRALMGTDKNALLVPQRAVMQMQGRYLIAIVDADNKVNIRPVEAGQRVGQDWVVKGEIEPTDRVVAEGVQKVRDGATVNPIELAATPAQEAAPEASPQTQ